MIEFQVEGGRRFSETRIAELADILNMPPEWQVCYPSGLKRKSGARHYDLGKPLVSMSSEQIRIEAVKKAQEADALVVRLRDVSGTNRSVTLMVDGKGELGPVRFAPYELKTLLISRKGRSLVETDLLERFSDSLHKHRQP